MIGAGERAPLERVLERLGNVAKARSGHVACCPAHDDREPSLSISVGADDRVLVRCHAGCSTEEIVAAAGLELRDLFVATRRSSWPRRARRRRESAPEFTAADARMAWERAFERAWDESATDTDRPVYEYLDRRGLGEAWELRAFGVIAAGMDLHPAVAHWPDSGHRILVPLHDDCGQVANVQARTVLRREPKTLFPAGGRVKGLAFADRRGVEVLRGAREHGAILLGEGLTDFLALSIASPMPVLASPGTSFVPAAIGHWAARRIVFIATDNDDAGEKVVQEAASRAYACGCTSARRVHWPGGGKDACDLVNARGMGALHDFLNSLAGEARP